MINYEYRDLEGRRKLGVAARVRVHYNKDNVIVLVSDHSGIVTEEIYIVPGFGFGSAALPQEVDGASYTREFQCDNFTVAGASLDD